MKSIIRDIDNHGEKYQALMFCCPGCAEMFDSDGIHILPINGTGPNPTWGFDGNLEAPTLTPSILTGKGEPGKRCHSFLRGGVFEFLGDSSHSLAGQKIPIPDLPTWAQKEEASTQQEQ